MNEKQKNYVELVASMSVDCLAGEITYETFLANLAAVIVMQLQEMEWDE